MARNQGNPPSEITWTRINLIVGKQDAMDAFAIYIKNRDQVVHEHWGCVHFTELKPQWESLKLTADAAPTDRHFCFTHNRECVFAAPYVLDSEDGLSMHRAQFRADGTLEVVSYDYAAIEFIVGKGLEPWEDAPNVEFR